jgi:hypothetical protein
MWLLIIAIVVVGLLAGWLLKLMGVHLFRQYGRLKAILVSLILMVWGSTIALAIVLIITYKP